MFYTPRTMDKDFLRDAEKMMADALKQMEETAKKAQEPPRKPSEITINFKSQRWLTIRKFLTCAFEMLIHGQTTLVIKKNS